MFRKYINKLGPCLVSLTAGIQPEKEPEETADSSYDLARRRAQRKGGLDQWIAQNLFQKTHDDLTCYDKDGESVAMDSEVGMDTSDIKAAFSLSAGNLPQVLFSWFVQQGFIGYQACSIISQHWLVDNACRIPAEDAIKNGYDLTVNDGSDVDIDIIAALRSYDKQFKVNKNLVEFSHFSRVFGIRIALFVVESDDQEYYLKPFNIDGVTKGSYKGIVQVDPYWITPELDKDAIGDPGSIDFYEPTWWRISGKRYHKSHLIITRHAEVTDILKPSYIYGGVPLPQKIYERVYAAERTANEAPLLAMTKRLNVIKTDMGAATANPEKFQERLLEANASRDNTGIYAIDTDDELKQLDTNLTDMDALIMTQYQLVAAIAGMPATKLLGTSPKGFNATGEYEQSTYYDLLEGIQCDDTEVLDRHYQLLIKSAIAPDRDIEVFEVEVNWKPLKSATPKEISDINLQDSTTDQNLINSGAIDGSEVRDRIIQAEDSGYNGLERIRFEEELEEKSETIPSPGERPESEGGG